MTIKDGDRAVLKIDGAKHRAASWPIHRLGASHVSRSMPGMKVHGVCKFLLLSTEPEFELYVTPINIDPENPAMPIGYPSVYPIYLAKQQGPFATLGLAEDTWGLTSTSSTTSTSCSNASTSTASARRCSSTAWTKCRTACASASSTAPTACSTCSGATRRADHPARPEEVPAKHRNAIEDLYRRMDDLVGRTMAKCQGDDTLLMVISDHGFNTFPPRHRPQSLAGRKRLPESRRRAAQ